MSLESLIKRLKDVMRKDSGADGDAQRLAQIVWLIFLKVLDYKEEEAEVKERIRYKELDVQNKSRKSKRLSEFIKYFFIIFIIILLYNVFSNTDFIRGLLLSLIAAIPIAAILGIVFIFYLIITFPTSETI